MLHEAYKKDYTAKFYRTAELASQLAVLDRSDPARLKFINQIVGCDLLILDDFLTTPINGEIANELFNLLAAREGKVPPWIHTNSLLRIGMNPCPIAS